MLQGKQRVEAPPDAKMAITTFVGTAILAKTCKIDA
jgi:hypothetical protein